MSNLIEQATGLKGTWSAAEGVFKVTAPRNDVKVNVDGWTMPPFMPAPPITTLHDRAQ